MSESTSSSQNRKRVFRYSYEGTTTTKHAPFPADPPVVSKGTVVALGPSYIDSFNGQRQPRWRDLIRNHLQATTYASGKKYTDVVFPPMTASLKQISVGKVGPLYTRIEGVFKASGTHSGQTDAFTQAPSNVVNAVHADQVAKGIRTVQSLVSSMQTGEDVVELRKAAATLVNPLSTLRKSLVSYLTVLTKKSNRGSLRRMHPSNRKTYMKKTLADTYLEYSFGWKPTVNAIASAYVGFQQQGNRVRYEPFEVQTTREFQSSDTEVGLTLSIPGTLYFGRVQVAKYTERWKGEVHSGADDNGRIGNMQLLGLTPDRWLPTVWNVLPYSWVADYFANIGDLITASTFRISDIAWACETKRHVTTVRYSFRRYAYGLAYEDGPFTITTRQGNAGGGNSHFEVVEFYRQPLTQFSVIPPFRFKIPELWSKPWLNIGALLAQKSRGISLHK